MHPPAARPRGSGRVMPTGPDSPSDTLHATGVLSKLLSAPVQIKAGFQVEVGSNDLQGFWIYKKTVNEQEA